MTDSLHTLTEAELRQMMGGELLDRAARHLDDGKVIERVVYDDGEIVAFWDDSPTAPEMAATGRDNGIALTCTCGKTKAGRVCDHAAALVLAWVRERPSFEVAGEGGDDDFAGIPEGWHEEDYLDAPPALGQLGAPLQAADPRAEYLRLLNSLAVPALRAIAQRRGLALSGTRRGPIVETLADALSQPDAVAQIWPSLSPDARLTAGLLPLLRTPSGVFLPHLLSALKAIDERAAANYDPTLEELANAGICVLAHGVIDCSLFLSDQLPPAPDFISAPAQTDGLKPEETSAPLDFALLATRALLALQTGGDQYRARPAPEPHRLAKQYPELKHWPHDPEELDALANEKRAAQLIDSKDFGVPPAPSPLTDEARLALSRAVGVEGDRVDFAVRLIAALNLIQLKPGKRVEVADAGLAEFLKHPLPARAAQLFTAAANLQTWTEFDLIGRRHRAPTLRRSGNTGQTYTHLLAGLASARVILLLQLRRAPAGRWIDFDALVTRARALFHNRSVWPMAGAWYPDLNGRRPNLITPADWQATYGPFAEAVLAGPLAWQGAVEVAYQKDRLVAFRLTDLGAYLVGQKPDFDAPPLESAGPVLKFSPGGTIALRAEAATTEVIGLMALLGEARGGQAGEIVYRPTAVGASRAFEAGWDAGRVLAVLEKAAGAPPPEALAQSVRKWWANFGNAHLYREVALIELADDYALNELLAGTSLAQHLLYRFGPRLVAIRPEGVEALKADLVKRGYTPKVARDG